VTLETLDTFVTILKELAKLAKTEPEKLRKAPSTTPVGRLDETKAARHPVLHW
jgi:glycine dehydrogenase subunit 2